MKADGAQTGLHESLSHAEGFFRIIETIRIISTTKALNHFAKIGHRCCIVVVVVVAVVVVAVVVFFFVVDAAAVCHP